MPIKPDQLAVVVALRRGRGRPLAAILTAGLVLAACTQGAPPAPTPGEEARRVLSEQRTAGPIRTLVLGNPFGMDEGRRNALVSGAMAQGVAGLNVRFTTWPDAAAAPEPHLVVALNPPETVSGDAACSAPARVTSAPAGDSFAVLAAFCQGDETIHAVREEASVSGPTDRRFERLLWRTAGALFPDNYAETYGFGILPRWLNFGIGGSFGGG